MFSSSEAIPITPFMGVRISWLMLATNWLLARLASASSRVRSRSCSLAFDRSSVRPESSCVRSRTRSSRWRRKWTTSRWTRLNRLASETAIEARKAAKPMGMRRTVGVIQPRSTAMSWT
ncbi:MAG: hypothetical protein DMF77_20430 [Acidobacteria bacterium]|nr:MAG: hypothetical protein DMF77_20430 [Acidobacteriota bacterium]